jgi:hypothetical protein
MRLNPAFLAAALGVLLAVGAATRPTVDLPEVGSPAPEVSASAWYNHIGTNPDLASLRGQAVLLEFWATW